MEVTELDNLRIMLDPVGQAGVALALMLVMFSVALGLRVDDFRFLFDKTLLFFGGVLAQVILLPLVTWLLIVMLAPPASVALGMIVVACCPGGAVSNLMTYLARGNVAVSVALTATSSLLAAILTPASILFWSHSYEPTSRLLKTLDVSPLIFLAQTTFLLALPLLMGMIVAAKAPDVAARIKRRATLFGTAALAGVVIYGIVYFSDILFSVLSVIGLVVLLHNALAFATGAASGLLLGDTAATRRALTFEIGIQNSGLALVILLSQLNGLGGAAAVAVFWGVWHLIAGSLIVGLFRIWDHKRQSLWQKAPHQTP
jgi:BASS family bile acid:Na+ symporter